MIFKVVGLWNKILYQLRFGKRVSFKGIPTFVAHGQIYAPSGHVQTGRGFTLKQGVYIAALNGGKVTIGDDVSINRNCILVCHDSISIADHCAIGPNTVFYDHDHNFGENGIEQGFKTAPIVIDKNCWIGAGVTVLRGTHIGEGSVIGAGTVVRGEIPPHSLVTSNREMKIVSIAQKGQSENP